MRKEGRNEGTEDGRKDVLYSERMRRGTDFKAEVGGETLPHPQVTGSRATTEVVRG